MICEGPKSGPLGHSPGGIRCHSRWVHLVAGHLARVVALEDAVDAAATVTTELHFGGVGWVAWACVCPGRPTQPEAHVRVVRSQGVDFAVNELALGVVEVLARLHVGTSLAGVGCRMRRISVS